MQVILVVQVMLMLKVLQVMLVVQVMLMMKVMLVMQVVQNAWFNLEVGGEQ